MGFKGLFDPTLSTKADIVTAASIGKKSPRRDAPREPSISSASLLVESKNLARRTIRYSNKIIVHEVPSVESYAKKGDELWITGWEYDSIQRREKRLSEKKNYEGCVGPDDEEIGLETKQSKKTKTALIRSSVKAVLTEQRRQLEQNENDPSRIVWAYSLVSLESGCLAHERGLINHYQLLEMNRPLRSKWSTSNRMKPEEIAGGAQLVQ
eukprot:scaffold5605_cov128-Cylindrotheca_fusiformis.AAC.24